MRVLPLPAAVVVVVDAAADPAGSEGFVSHGLYRIHEK